jgi:hypothetical protein
MSCPVEVFKSLSPEVSGHQRAEGAGGGVANEVNVTDLLRDDAQAKAEVESLYLWAKDLAEGHILSIRGPSVGDGGPGRRRYNIWSTWYIHELVCVFRNERQVTLLAAKGRRW